MRLRLATIAFVLLVTPAFAADTPPPTKPSTAAELQQQADYWKAAYQAAAQQRDQANAALANMQADLYAKQATAPKPPEAK